MITAIQIISLFFAVWFTTVNLALIYRGEAISHWNFVIQAAAISTFVVIR